MLFMEWLTSWKNTALEQLQTGLGSKSMEIIIRSRLSIDLGIAAAAFLKIKEIPAKVPFKMYFIRDTPAPGCRVQSTGS